MSLEVIGELARHVGERPLLILGDYRPDEFPTEARALHREWRARLLGQRQAEEVRLRRFTPRGDRHRDDAHPGRRAAGPEGRRGRDPRPHERDPAPHRGAPRRARRRGSGRRAAHPRRPRPRHDRRRGPGAPRAAVGGRPERRPRRGGRRALLHPRRPRRDRRAPAGRARAGDPGARRRGVPLPLRLHRRRLLRLPPPAPPGRDLRLASRRPSCAASTPAPPSS